MAEARLAFAVPGDLETRTGGTIYDRRVVGALREAGWQVELLTWPASFPFPSQTDRQATTASLAALPDDALVVIDGLAFGAIPEIAENEAARLRLVALVHHPLALETSLDSAVAAMLAASERRALDAARAIIVTSQATADGLTRDYGQPAGKITVALPGVDPAPPRRDRQEGPVRLLAVGSVTPRKAHHVLVAALVQVADQPWRCVIAGPARDAPYAAALTQQIAALGLAERIELAGEISDEAVSALYDQADLFVLASVYEGYGMVFAEAMAHGLPIIATTGGAIPQVVSPDAGLLLPPGDAGAMAKALRTLLTDEPRRADMAAAARRHGLTLGDWNGTAKRIAEALARL